MITQAKRAVLKMAQKEIGMNDDDYRDMLYGITGGRCTSSTAKNFYDSDFKAVMKMLEQFGYNKKLKMTKSQFSTILKLNKKLGWSGQPKRLAGYCKRVLGFEDWKKADTKQAAQFIRALIKILEFEREKTNV